jgi:mono/diheme cytochrome c family protein/glucose/arabinose dehydrogenase
MKRARSASVIVLLAAAAGLTALAQQPPPPAPVPASAPPATAPPGRAGAPADPAAGRGRVGGRGGLYGVPTGGSMKDDPAYATVDFSPKAPVVPLPPVEEVKRLWLPPGFKLEPVLSDPDIEESAQIAFDGNGRMFVLELRGYMQDKDGGGTLLPVGRISVHEDGNNDGVYETHKVFVDKLIFPRFVTPLGGGAILTKESNADELWKYTDTNNDGVADRKDLFATGFGRLANVEHQESGLMWSMDNWLYSTVNATRLRWTPNGVIKEPTGASQSQWGVTQDNYGKTWFQAGASGMPGYFQFPIAYGNFAYPDQFEQDLTITWGAPVLIADMQGGLNSTRMPDGSLARSTGAAGNDVYRGDRLPKDMLGDYFYGEVVARIVRRLRPTKTEGLTQLRNVYPLSEFIKSTDPLFRPVDVTTAPDGTMYITDMYRGIIQESQWSGPGTYLRARVEQYQLDKVFRKGRIWRLTYEGMPRDTTQPRMLSETPAQLVTRLTHPNGWWRDTAQQLLVLKQDKSVVPALKQMFQSSTNQLARIHALWTLEGLGAIDAPLARAAMEDKDPQIRFQAVRASESLYKGGDKSMANDYRRLTKDPDTDVVIQSVMTLNSLKVADAKAVITETQAANKAKGVQLVTDAILKGTAAPAVGLFGAIAVNRTPAEAAMLEKGKAIYTELCFSCHGDDGRGTPKPGAGAGVTMAPPLAGSPRVVGHRDFVVQALLHGVTGPVDGETYTEVMIPMGQNPDDWVAAIGSYIRNEFGNVGDLISTADVSRVRAAGGPAGLRTVEQIQSALPTLAVVQPTWKAAASHNAGNAGSILTINPWTSGEPQKPGMWVQVELPAPIMLAEVSFESTIPPAAIAEPGAPTRTGNPGGGRGAPGAPAPPPPPIGSPIAYQIQVSMDGTTWSAPVAQGQGTGASTVAAFKPVQARFVRITQTGTSATAPAWTVQRLKLYEKR